MKKTNDLNLFDEVVFNHKGQKYSGTITKINDKSVLIAYIPNPEEAKRSGVFVESTVRKTINSNLIKVLKSY